MSSHVATHRILDSRQQVTVDHCTHLVQTILWQDPVHTDEGAASSQGLHILTAKLGNKATSAKSFE